MTVTDISHVSSIATQKTNTTGVLSPILEISPTEGQALIIDPTVPMGKAAGVPIYATLLDGTGSDLPLDTNMALTYEAPEFDEARAITDVKKNIRPYRKLNLSEQQNAEHVDAVKHKLKKSKQFVVRHIDTLNVAVNSSAQIDWGQNPEIYIDENAVNEVPMSALEG